MRGFEQVAKQCVENVNFYTKAGMPAEDAAVMITTPQGWKAPPRFPRGEVLLVREDGARVRRLPALRLLAWLAGNGLINVKFEELKQ